MRETSWVRKEEPREARKLFVTGYKQASNLTQAELADLLVLLSSVTHSGPSPRWLWASCGRHMDMGSCQPVKQNTDLMSMHSGPIREEEHGI